MALLISAVYFSCHVVGKKKSMYSKVTQSDDSKILYSGSKGGGGRGDSNHAALIRPETTF
jgi:hypothetical protein